MDKKLLFLIASIVVVFLVAVAAVGIISTSRKSNSLVQGESTSVPAKVFTVTGTNYAFDPSTITVNKGDTVKIIFKDDDGIHNLVVAGYGVSTRTINSGQDVVEFVADKTGEFEYYCSVGSHRDLGMTGTLLVK